jgi:ADP-ribose pyrophosphatase
MIRPWQKIGSKPSGNFRIFNIRTDRKVSPRTGTEHDFYIIESVNWVNAIAMTPNEELVMVEQYRHGSETVELEIPGGMLDAHDDSPAAGGIRELREETGYEGEQPQIIGKIFPNPAIMNNVCHTLWVRNCQLKYPVQWDRGEDLITRLVPWAEVPGLVAAGKIRHALVVVAIYHFDLKQREVPPVG